MIYVCPLTTPFQQYLSSNVEIGFWFIYLFIFFIKSIVTVTVLIFLDLVDFFCSCSYAQPVNMIYYFSFM